MRYVKLILAVLFVLFSSGAFADSMNVPSGAANPQNFPLAPYTGWVATRGMLLKNTTTGSKQVGSITAHVAQDTINAPQIVLSNFYVTNVGVETGSGGVATYTGAIEYPIGTFTQMLCSGSSTCTVPNKSYLVSDPLPIQIPQSALFRVRLHYASTVGIVYLSSGSNLNLGLGEAMQYGATVPDHTMGGAVVNTDGASDGGLAFGPLGIIGVTKRRSYTLIGDSIGLGIFSISQGATANIGIADRGICQVAACSNFSVTSTTIQQYVTGTNSTLQMALANAYSSDVVYQRGSNDFTAGRTKLQIEADDATAIASTNTKRNWLATITPVTTSTDNWATLAGQTVTANEAVRTGLNTDIRTGTVIAGQFGYFDPDLEVEYYDPSVPSFSGKWNVPFYSFDGTHQTYIGDIAASNAYSPGYVQQ